MRKMWAGLGTKKTMLDVQVSSGGHEIAKSAEYGWGHAVARLVYREVLE
jgi:hypothetical protein